MSLTFHGTPAPRAYLVQRAAPELELPCDLVPDSCTGKGAGGQGQGRGLRRGSPARSEGGLT
jgi:hypothetical protein